MKTTSFVSLFLLASSVRADEPKLDTSIQDMRRTYDKVLAEFKRIADKDSAIAGCKELDKLLDQRDRLQLSIAKLNLNPAERESAQSKLDAALKPVSQEIMVEVARVSLIPAALEAIEKQRIVSEFAELIEQTAKERAVGLKKALQVWAIKNDGMFPERLADAGRYLAEPKKYLRDPWGREWNYDPTGKRNNGNLPDIWTVSPFAGGKKVIGNWQLGGAEEMTLDNALEAVRSLPPRDRRLVAETILDELDVTDPALLSDDEREFIDQRIAAYRKNPEGARPYDEVVARIRRRPVAH
jgi:putative addiction module component (TIGR02574 family)